jgi:Zn-dependent peptidase ImmA (M78 family)/transcriptional regulator with XRE-family HTH domain
MAQKLLFDSPPFNSNILRWARMLGAHSYEDAAKAANVAPKRIEEWESNKSQPTVKQARKLAELYRRPFLEFFGKAVPQIDLTQLVPDFRLSKNHNHETSEKALLEVQEWAETQRLNAIDLFELNNEVLPTTVNNLNATITQNPETAAETTRNLINFPIEEQFSFKSNDRHKFFKFLRSKVEDIGILVLKNSGLKDGGARGLCVFTSPLPVIVIGTESPSGSAFTLGHELGHIALKQSAISGLSIPRKIQDEKSRVEKWCDSFAAAFLIPETPFRRILPSQKKVSEISEDKIREYANKFSVSRHAMLVRLVELNLVDEDFYWDIKRPQYLKEELNLKLGGRSTYYGSRYRNSNGDLYTGLVLEAWTSGIITNHNAAEFMGIKNLRHLSDIRKYFSAGE